MPTNHRRPIRGFRTKAPASRADETVDLVDGASVAVGDDGHDFAAVAVVGGVFYELVVYAGEEREILGVIDKDVIRFQLRAGGGVGAHAERQIAAAEQSHV